MPHSSPLHHHQSSLEGVIYFSAEPTLGTDQRTNAKRRFYRIVEYFEAASSSRSSGDYSRPRLVHLTYDYTLSEESRDNFLRAFFWAMALSIDGSEEDIDAEDLRSPFFGFADYLLDNFFLPLKASSKRTPPPSPAFHSAVQGVQGGDAEAFVGTTDRLAALRGACLTRDRHRCVISRKFDLEEGEKRMRRDGDSARDDDGDLLLEDANPADFLEVAHILPHSLMKADIGSELNPSKQAALAILNMLDSGVVHLVEGVEIDRPRNAITLTHVLHRLFGDFLLFFEPIPDRQHTYRIRSCSPVALLLRNPAFPITRTLYLTDTWTIDPPSPRLLAIHSAIAHILHLSAAGEYIDKLLLDMDGKDVKSDGSTELGRLVKLRLGGYLDGPSYS